MRDTEIFMKLIAAFNFLWLAPEDVTSHPPIHLLSQTSVSGLNLYVSVYKCHLPIVTQNLPWLL